MAAGSFLDGQGSGVALSVDGDVVQEVIVGLWESSRVNDPLDSCRTSPLEQTQNHADSRLEPKLPRDWCWQSMSAGQGGGFLP